MSGKLTAKNIRLMLAELHCAEKYRESPGTHASCINGVRDILLRAALGDVDVDVDVDVETEKKP